MILTIAGADFSGANIGTNTSVGISYNGRVTGKPTSIEKNTALTSTITINTGYTYDSITSVTVGGQSISEYIATDNGDGTVTLTIPANKITGRVVVTVSTTANSTGGDTTMYTFTINPTPSTATVTLTASGYSQSGNSITVPANTSVTWKVSASGYTEQNGTHTVTKTESKSVTLSSASGGGETKTTIGTTNYETTIVGTWNEVILTPDAIISTSGGSNCTVNTTSTGRCSNINYVLQVNGGETLSFTATDLVESWALSEFNAVPLIKSNFTPKGDASKSWLTGNATLQTGTRYIILNFKKKGSGSFSESDMASVKSTITIN